MSSVAAILLAFLAAAFAALWLRSRRALSAAAAREDALAAEKAALARDAERLFLAREVFDQLPVSLFLVTPDHRIAILNKATEKLAGVPREQILRNGCFGPFCDRRSHYEKCPGHAAFFTGKDWNGDTEINGRHYDVAVRPLRHGSEIPYTLVSLSDTTEFVHHRSVLEKVVPRLETLLRNTAKIRDCIVQFATGQDPDVIFTSALSTIADLFHATYTFLCRFDPDGSLVRTHAKVRAPEYDQNYLTPHVRGEIARRFSHRSELLYRLGQIEDHVDEFDSMLTRARSTNVYCAAIHDEAGVWGYLGILSDNDVSSSPEETTLRHDIVNLLEIGVRRAKLIQALDSEKHELIAATEAAKQAARAKASFLATMSHEIRTPLNAVIGFSELLAAPGLPQDTVREYTNGITRASNALLNLINDILDFSKLEYGTADMRGSCDLPRLFDDMAAIFTWRARDKGIALKHDIPSPFPRLDISEPHMRHILLNLIGNAVKFTDQGSVEWSAALTREPDGSESLDIAVRDTGIGIDPAMHEAIFDPFVQDIASRGGKVYAGTGLGLPIVKRLLESRSGTIRVESAPGKGSAFFVHIPRVSRIEEDAAQPRERAPAPAPEPLPREAAPAPGASDPDSAPAAPAPPQVPLVLPPGFRALLVDDIAVNLRILALHLRALGITDCECVSSGRLALEALRRRPASIILTDVWMPDGNGADLARAMHEDPALASIPIIALTADNNVSDTFDTSLFTGVLTKPLSSDKLRDIFTRVLGNKP